MRLFVLNRAHRGSVLAREAPQALEQHGALAGVVHQWIAIAEASAAGESVLTWQPKGGAAVEIRRLWRALGRTHAAQVAA